MQIAIPHSKPIEREIPTLLSSDSVFFYSFSIPLVFSVTTALLLLYHPSYSASLRSFRTQADLGQRKGTSYGSLDSRWRCHVHLDWKREIHLGCGLEASSYQLLQLMFFLSSFFPFFFSLRLFFACHCGVVDCVGVDFLFLVRIFRIHW